jgi:hypothetical protein
MMACGEQVPPASPTIGFSPSSLSFSAEEGGANPASKTLSISNSGGGTLDWTVTADANWVSLSPTSGASTGESDSVTVSVDISGMDAADYAAIITISAPGASNSPRTVTVDLSISAPSPPTTPEETDTYTNSEYGFSVDYYKDKDWDVMEDYMGMLVAFMGPLVLEEAYYINVGIVTEEVPEDMTLQNYVDASLLVVKRTYADFNKVEEYGTTISGLPATVVVLTGTLEMDETELQLKQKGAMFIKDEVAYTISYNAPVEFYDEYADSFDLAINSFKFD